PRPDGLPRTVLPPISPGSDRPRCGTAPTDCRRRNPPGTCRSWHSAAHGYARRGRDTAAAPGTRRAAPRAALPRASVTPRGPRLDSAPPRPGPAQPADSSPSTLPVQDSPPAHVSLLTPHSSLLTPYSLLLTSFHG